METNQDMLDKMAGIAGESTQDERWIVYRPSADEGRERAWPPPMNLDHYPFLAQDEPEVLELKPELIGGVLRGGQKMLISGASKAGKTCLLMELGLCLAMGWEWLGFPCRKSKVLFVNMELEELTAVNRFREICEAWDVDWGEVDNLALVTLRGLGMTLRDLMRYLKTNADYMAEDKEQPFEVIIIDPIYKLLDGEENSMAAVKDFCGAMDWISSTLDVAVIYSHHHSKGSKGNVRAMDRSSGSGVFARDPDALLDLIELDVPAKLLEDPENALLSAWRMEPVLRNFPSFDPVNLFFRWPVHELDSEGLLDRASTAGSGVRNLKKSGKRTSARDRKKSVQEAFDALATGNEPVEVRALAKEIGVTERCVRDRLKELEEEYWVKSGLVGRKAG